MMINHTIIYVIATVLTLNLLALIGNEAYHYFVKKQDRRFWSGVGMLILITIIGIGVRQSYDAVQLYHLNNLDNLISTGYIGKEAVEDVFPDVAQGVCLLNGSEESKRCRFFTRFNYSDDSSIHYFTTDKESILRYGQWPFAKTLAVEPVDPLK